MTKKDRQTLSLENLQVQGCGPRPRIGAIFMNEAPDIESRQRAD